jgi:putative hydrolase of the HAD superfamily
MQNLALYGFGVKSFMLSMIETAIRISDKSLNIAILEKIIQLGKDLINKEIEILEGVEEVLKAFSGKYKLVVATKGDLLDQERKLRNSGIEHYFHHIEIMSDKQESDYKKLIKHLDILPEQFMMIGNSLKSDVLPILALGGIGVHVPYHVTWAHEKIETKVDHPNFIAINKITEIIAYLNPG